MTFLAPLWLGAAVLAALGVVALHLITTQRPPPSMLPTARFVPAGESRASSKAARPTDQVLLLVRCLALLLLGAAFAGPVSLRHGTRLSRVIVADRSRSATADVRDSALAVARPGDALVLVDSAATIVMTGATDSLRSLSPARARGSLSAAMVGARRAARDLASGSDSVELVIVSPLTIDEIDSASARMFASWPGRARLIRTVAARPSVAGVTLVSDDPDDALRPPVSALNARHAPAGGAATAAVRIVRAAPRAADSLAARGGAAIVYWPRAGAGTEAPFAQGLWAGGATLVAPLARLPIPARGLVVARWADGAPAAAEETLGRGCIRSVGVGVPSAGDVTLQPEFSGVARALVAPCYGAAVGDAAADSIARRFARGGAAATAASLRSGDERSSLAPWLLAAALLVLAAETFVRRDAAGAAA